MSGVKCPICDAEGQEPCYDPHGKLSYREKHHARVEAEREAMLAYRLREKDEADHQAEITRINQEISRLIARRSYHEKALRDETE